MFSFTPQSEEEVLNLMPAGVYEFYVHDAEFTHSKKSGNPMIKLDLRVIDHLGNEKPVTDYLMEVMMYKVKHFCDAVGLEDEYKNGAFDADMCKGKNGKCKIIIDQPEEGSPFSPKNTVKDYVKRVKEDAKEQAKEEEKPFFDDDVSF